MKRPPGFTLIELLVVISIIGLLAALALPAINGALKRAQMTQTLSNARQLFTATFQASLDAATTGSGYGWPADGGGSWAAWTTNLTNGYLSANDFRKLISAPGRMVAGSADLSTVGASNGLKLYNVGEASPNDNLFLSSANVTFGNGSGVVSTTNNVPFGDAGVVIFRKGGDGLVIRWTQRTDTNLVTSTNLVSGG